MPGRGDSVSSLTASMSHLAVRIKNSRYDGMLTGYLHGGVRFQKADPGGFMSASFVVDQRLGFRSDLIQAYSRLYIMDKASGKVVFEGDITNPGRSVGDSGFLYEIQVKGPALGALADWSNSRIYVDRDLEPHKLASGTTIGTTAEKDENRAGTADDALILAFPNSFHVETNAQVETRYDRIVEAGQFVGFINYRWDAGLTNGSWIIRAIGSPPSTVVRSQSANTAGSGLSGVNVSGSDYTKVYFQFQWTSSPSSTGTGDTVWASIMDLVVVARVRDRNGTWQLTGYGNEVSAARVIGDLLGDPAILSAQFDSANARIDLGAAYAITQLAYPDGVQVPQILEDLMRFEPACTYYCGASNPTNGKYSFAWIERSRFVRYEAMLAVDAHESGAQEVEQYNRAVARWRTPIGQLRITASTQSIPEMTAAGRTRTFFQDLSNTVGSLANAQQANASVLEQHRYPENSGTLSINRQVVDLFTGRRVEPYEIEPGYMIRLVGIDPYPDAINYTAPNGGTVCRIVQTDYDGSSNSASLNLDGVPLSLMQAIRNTRTNRKPPTRKA